MKASKLRKGLRIKVKQSCGIEICRNKYGTVQSDVLTECNQVLIKIDGYDGCYAGNVKLKPTAIKLSDEKPDVGDRIVVLSKPTDYYEIGAIGIVQCVNAKGMSVKFDEGVYLRSDKVLTWYVGYHRKIGIIRNIEGA